MTVTRQIDGTLRIDADSPEEAQAAWLEFVLAEFAAGRCYRCAGPLTAARMKAIDPSVEEVFNGACWRCKIGYAYGADRFSEAAMHAANGKPLLVDVPSESGLILPGGITEVNLR